MAQFVESNHPVLFRVTGKQSVERLEPLLINNKWGLECLPVSTQQLQDGIVPNFVWETTCEKDLRNLHQKATIINKLHNTQIIESKANLAFLQLKMKCPTLETFIAPKGKLVMKWFSNRWASSEPVTEGMDWWAVKASNGNGGKDIWIVNRDNYQAECSELRDDEEYVIQK